jgi:CheY-like chemotaxis protein
MLDVPSVEANEVRLGQVFHALLTNAALAIREGDAANNEVRVRTHCDSDGRVVVEIADTGCGIPPDVLPHAFDPFFTTRAFGDGTGLGLSIAYGTVVALGGEMRVASTPGTGSAFEIVLPAASGMPSSRRLKVARPRLLLIEEDERVAEAASRTLGEEYDLELARGARDALALFTRGVRFDVVLCELAMSLGSGIDLYAETLRVAPQLAKRFVFLTSGVLTPNARAFVEGSGARCIEKPVDLGALREMLRRFR